MFAPRRGQVRDTLYPLERQVAASAAPPREARRSGNALRVLRLRPNCPGTRRPAPLLPRSPGHRESPRERAPLEPGIPGQEALGARRMRGEGAAKGL